MHTFDAAFDNLTMEKGLWNDHLKIELRAANQLTTNFSRHDLPGVVSSKQQASPRHRTHAWLKKSAIGWLVAAIDKTK